MPLRGNVGRASTNEVDDESLADCAARARLAAEAAEAVHDGTFPGFDPDYDAVRAATSFDPATAELDPAGGGAALADAFVEADAHGVEAHGIWTVAEQDQAWATEAGGGAGAPDRRLHEGDLHRARWAQRVCVAGRRRGRRAFAGRARRACRTEGERTRRAGGAAPGRVHGGVRAAGGRLAARPAGRDGLQRPGARGGPRRAVGPAGRDRSPLPAINLADSPTSPRTLPRSFDAEGTRKAPAAADPGRGGPRGRARRAQRRPRRRGEHRPRAGPGRRPRAGPTPRTS